MAGEKLTLPKLPPGKRVEQVLAMREADFAEVAQGAGMTPQALRERLEKILERSSEAGQRANEAKREERLQRKQKEIKGRAGKRSLPFSWDSGFKEGLRVFLHEDLRAKNEADEKAAFARADAAASRLPDRGGYSIYGRSAIDPETKELYRSAYMIRMVRMVVTVQKESATNYSAAHSKVLWRFRKEELGINQPEQRAGLGLALYHFERLGSPAHVKARELYDAIQTGGLTPVQKKDLEEQKETAIYSPWNSELSRIVHDIYLEIGLISGREDRSGVAISGQDGINGGYAYYRHSRPHRDDYGASGGEDEK